MATVILPFGYPQLSGFAFETVLIQGVVARMYTVGADPRTNSQSFERKMLSDISKMRSAAGVWAKSAWRLTFGDKWSSIIYQLVKADFDGWWSYASEMWNETSQSAQDLWRADAPFQATFNDPGKVFFQLAILLWHWDEENYGHRYYQPDPYQDPADDMAWWWTAALSDFGWQEAKPIGKTIDDRDLSLGYSGSWQIWDVVGALNGTVKQGLTNGSFVQLTDQFTWVRFVYSKNTDGGNFKVTVDGVDVANLNGNGALQHQVIWDDVYRATQPHTIKVTHMGGAGEKLNVDALKIYTIYRFSDAELVSGSWTSFLTGGPTGSDGYEITGSGGGEIVFNLVSAYLLIYYRTRPSYGLMRVFVDGAPFDEFSQYSVSDGFASRLVGRFRYGLHRVQIIIPVGQKGSVYAFYPLRKKSDV